MYMYRTLIVDDDWLTLTDVMRKNIIVRLGRGPDLSHASVCAPSINKPVSTSGAALLIMFAFGAHDTAVGSLSLEPAMEFAMYASSLRLAPASLAEQEQTAVELLRFAVRNDPCLCSGGALLAKAAPTADPAFLERVGFVTVSSCASDDATARAKDDEGARVKHSPPLMCLHSRWASPPELAESVHVGGGPVAIRISSMPRSLDFWSLLDFSPTRRFSTSGARATYLMAPWSTQALELIEVPPVLMPTTSPSNPEQLGLTHLCLDATPICVELADLLALLQQRSLERFGRNLRVVMPPHQQMLGRLVIEAVVLRAPDGVHLRLMRRSAVLAQALEADWT